MLSAGTEALEDNTRMAELPPAGGGQLRRTAVNLSVRCYFRCGIRFVGQGVRIVVGYDKYGLTAFAGLSIIAGGDRSRLGFTWCAPERWTYAACVRKPVVYT
jgi:hypothetical protein